MRTRNCTYCNFEPKWDWRDDLLMGRLKSGECLKTGQEIDIVGDDYMGDDGPIENCPDYEAR